MDDDELRALIEEAWEHKNTPYFKDAVDHIIYRWERRHLTRWESEQHDAAQLADLLRNTNPS